MRGPVRNSLLAVSVVALVVAVSAGAYAAGLSSTSAVKACVHRRGGGLYLAHKCARHDRRFAAGGALAGSYPDPSLAAGVITDANVKPGSLTGASVNANTLGKVPAAANADQLGGAPRSSYQSRVTGSCPAGAGIAQVNSDGSVSCGNVEFYGGRLEVGLPFSGHPTFLTVPGIAHVSVLHCNSANANVQLTNDSGSAADLWSNQDSTWSAPSWASSTSALTTTAGTTWHLGEGSGPGAKLITINMTTVANESNCVYQGTAEVITAS